VNTGRDRMRLRLWRKPQGELPVPKDAHPPPGEAQVKVSEVLEELREEVVRLEDTVKKLTSPTSFQEARSSGPER